MSHFNWLLEVKATNHQEEAYYHHECVDEEWLSVVAFEHSPKIKARCLRDICADQDKRYEHSVQAMAYLFALIA